jgi:signal transduction histidine kinase
VSLAKQSVFAQVARRLRVPTGIQGRLVHRLGILIFIAVLVFGVTVAYYLHQAEQDAWRGRQGEAARHAAGTVADVVRQADGVLAMAGTLAAPELAADARMLQSLLLTDPALLEIARLDASGQVLASAGREQALLAGSAGIAQSPWFLTARAGESYLGDLEAAATDEPYVLLAGPAADGGVVAARLRMHFLWDIVAGIRFGASGRAYVINSAGTILAHANRALTQTPHSLQGRPELAALQAAPGAEWYGEYVNLDGAPVVGASALVAGTDWVVVTELAQDEAFASSRTALLVLGVELLVFAFLLLALMWVSVSALIVRPIRELRAGAERIGQGDLDYRIDAKLPDEVDQLGAAFNDMADRLQERDVQDTLRTATLAAEVTERKRVEGELLRAHEDLEQRVQDRTAQLEQANRDLQAEVSERRETEERLGAQKRLFESLVAVARATSERPALDATLENTLQVALDLTGSENGDLLLFDHRGEVISNIVMGQHGNAPFPPGITTRVMAGGLAGWVARSRQGTIVPDTAQDERWLHLDEVPYSARSALSVPIVTGTALVGVITLVHAKPGHFTGEHLELMQAAADQMALAMRNAQIFDAQRRTADRQTMLYQVLRTIGVQFDAGAVIDYAVRAIDEFGIWPHLSYSALEDDGVHWVIRAASGRMGTEVGARHRVDEGIIGRAFRTGRTQIVPDVTADADYVRGASPACEALCSEMSVPVRSGGDIAGVLNMESEQRNAFDASDMQTAELLADAIGLALDNARLYTAAQHELAERRRAEAALRQYADELEARNQELDAFAHTVAHDLKNPAALISGYAQLLEVELRGGAPEAANNCVDSILRSALKMHTIIDDLLLLAEVRKVDVARRPLDMASILAEAQRRVADTVAVSQAEIHMPERWPAALGYAPWVEEVWVNYLSNALKYGGRPPRVELGAAHDADGMVRFWVRDNGRGLTAEDQEHLFTPFTRLAQGGERGYGLGLSIVRRIVEKLGGQVRVTSTGVAGEGSEFSFTLPAA